jgi:uncharacterized protein (DUF342 family)
MAEKDLQQKTGEIDIEVSTDNMEATLCLAPDDKEKVFDVSHLKALLRESGIVFGINEKLLENIVHGKKYYKTYIVAQGQAPENGKDGWFEFLFPIDIDTKPKILKDGSVDYTACGQVPSVDEGQEIVRYHAATKATDGMDVKGGILAGKNGKDLARLRGKGFLISQDNLSYTARVTGKATYERDVLNVDSELVIDGDVAYTTTGNVHFVNDIHIRGNVLTGMSVVSEKGSIIVDGYVEAATLVAKKDIVLKNGMQGNGQGKIATSGSVSGKFFEQSFIDCDGSVAANAIMNCEITCGEDVKVSGRFGAIIGGSVSAMRCIESMIIGNMAEVRTDICAGIEGDLFTLLSQLEARQKKLQEEVEAMVEAIKKIETMIEAGAGEDLQKKKLQLTRAKIDRDSKMNEIIKRKQETLEQMGKSQEAKVTIVKRVYPGTTITINGMRVSVQDEIASVEYTRRGSGIVSYSLT